MARREDEGDEGGGEQHLDDGHIAIIAAEDLGKGIGMVDAEALGGAYHAEQRETVSRLDQHDERFTVDSPTAKQEKS